MDHGKGKGLEKKNLTGSCHTMFSSNCKPAMGLLEKYNGINLVGWDNSIVDIWVPFFAMLEFILYLGWLR